MNIKNYVFKSLTTDEAIVCGSFGDPLWYSPDGITYYELFTTWTGGSPLEEYKINFEDPHHQRSGMLTGKENLLAWDGKIFKRMQNPPSKLTLIFLPTVREAKYLFQLKNGTFIYISQDRYEPTHTSFKCFLGSGDNFVVIPITNVAVLRDGGTTYIETKKASLYMPAPQEENLKPTWGDEKIKKLNPKNFLIKEEKDTITIFEKR